MENKRRWKIKNTKEKIERKKKTDKILKGRETWKKKEEKREKYLYLFIYLFILGKNALFMRGKVILFQQTQLKW